CKADHMVLFDYMYDEGSPDRRADQRPPYDKFNADMDKALSQLKTIKKNYPNIPSLPVKDKAGKESITPAAIQAVNNWIDGVKAKFPDMEAMRPNPKEPKAPLTLVEEEIDFRRKILATRNLLMEQSFSLIDWYQSNQQEDIASKYRDIAS